MRPSRTRTERRRDPGIAMLGALSGLLLLLAPLRVLWGGSVRASAWMLVGALVAFVCWASAPVWLVTPAAGLHRVLRWVGDAISTVLLSVVYLVLVWPYHGVLRLFRAIDPPEEPWPPPDVTGWQAVDARGAADVRRSRAGSFWAQWIVWFGGVASLLGFLRKRAVVVLPVALLVLLMGAIALIGSTTGLGPLVYSLF